MRKLLFILSLFITSFSFANVSSVIDSGKQYITETKNLLDTSSNFKMMWNDAKNAVSIMASSLKTSSEYVLKIYAKYYMLKGIYNFLCVLICIFSIYFLYRIGKKYAIGDNSPAWIFIGLAMIILSLLLVKILETAVLYTFNPEYYVFNDFLNIIKTWK